MNYVKGKQHPRPEQQKSIRTLARRVKHLDLKEKQKDLVAEFNKDLELGSFDHKAERRSKKHKV